MMPLGCCRSAVLVVCGTLHASSSRPKIYHGTAEIDRLPGLLLEVKDTGLMELACRLLRS
jgi:hypothetical protein